MGTGRKCLTGSFTVTGLDLLLIFILGAWACVFWPKSSQPRISVPGLQHALPAAGRASLALRPGVYAREFSVVWGAPHGILCDPGVPQVFFVVLGISQGVLCGSGYTSGPAVLLWA